MDRQKINKEIVLRFNLEFLQNGDESVLEELMHPQFINHTAPPGFDKGIAGIRSFLKDFLHKAFRDLRVEVFQQVAENDLVTTYKAFHGKHTGRFMDIEPTSKNVVFRVMDIVRLEEGKYMEHWGIRDTYSLLQQLTN